MANKIKYGLQNVYYAKITAVTTGGYSYTTPVAWPGAVNLSMTQESGESNFYADNVVYWKTEANNGYSGTLETALIPDDFRTDILGEVLDAKGFYVESADAHQSEFALMFQFEGDENATRHCFYRCIASRPDVNGATKEETIEPQTETVNLSAMARLTDHVVKARAPYTAATTSSYQKWFTAVQEPTAA